MKILITSGRSFVALDFVRILQNHEIFVQESQEEHICKKSCYVRETLHTKSPKYFYVEYKKSILKFVKKRKIDIIIPTCEDIFYISQFRDEITEL